MGLWSLLEFCLLTDEGSYGRCGLCLSGRTQLGWEGLGH